VLGVGLHPQVRPTVIPFDVDGRHLILVDDVLYTGRTTRAALNELFDYGRPASVELAVLADRVAGWFVAGLLLAAILSDTLVFRSPTCTPVDVSTANRLAKIAGVEIDAFASEMFEAGEKLDGKTPEEVFLQDFKVFMCGDVRFGVAQGSYMTRKNLKAAQQLLTPYLPEACGKQNVEDLYMLLTDVPKEESVVICTGRHADEMLRSGFEKEPEEDGSWVLPGVVSRKKQFIPALMSAYQEL
jgi:manganese-dependent inorganic pyrophosphatase